MSEQKTLILTVGLPRSGKSTWALSTGYPTVNRDAIRLALHGQAYVPAAEEMITAMETYMVKSLFLAGHSIVIIDATHLTEERRIRWNNKNWKVELAILPTHPTECRKRAIESNKENLLEVINRMQFTAQWPAVCPFYPLPFADCVCAAGSDLSGGSKCSLLDARNCPWFKKHSQLWIPAYS